MIPSLPSILRGAALAVAILGGLAVHAGDPVRTGYLLNWDTRIHVLKSRSATSPVRLSWTDPETGQSRVEVYAHPFCHVIDRNQALMLELPIPMDEKSIEQLEFDLISDPDGPPPSGTAAPEQPRSCWFMAFATEEQEGGMGALLKIPPQAVPWSGVQEENFTVVKLTGRQGRVEGKEAAGLKPDLLRGADLRGAYLRGADLRGLNL